jgi:hypothetical protein
MLRKRRKDRSFSLQINRRRFLQVNPWMFEQSYLEPQQQPQYQSKACFMEDYVSMLLEDSEKLMEKLVKELGQQIINDCDVSTSISTCL